MNMRHSLVLDSDVGLRLLYSSFITSDNKHINEHETEIRVGLRRQTQALVQLIYHF